MTDHRWKPGQEVIFNGRIVTIERVTPSGRAVIEGRTFNPDGMLRGWSSVSSMDKQPFIVEATPERKAEIAQRDADRRLCDQFWAALRRLDAYARQYYGSFIYGGPFLGEGRREALPGLIAAMDHVTGHNAEKKESSE